MITNNEKELLVRGILTNSIDNNIYSRKTNPDPEIIGLFLKFAREDTLLLKKALQLFNKHGIVENIKYYILAALTLSADIKTFKNAFPSVITTLKDIYDFSILLESDKTDIYGFKLDGLAKDLLQKRFAKLSEIDLVPYYKLTKTKSTINISELKSLLKPEFENPNIEKALAILFGKKSKHEIKENELPLLWALNKIEKENSPAEIHNLIMKYNIPFEWAIPVANITDYKILRLLLDNIQPDEMIDFIDAFVNAGCINEEHYKFFHDGWKFLRFKYKGKLSNSNVRSFEQNVDLLVLRRFFESLNYSAFKTAPDNKKVIFKRAPEILTSKEIDNIIRFYRSRPEQLRKYIENTIEPIFVKFQLGLMGNNVFTLPFKLYFALSNAYPNANAPEVPFRLRSEINDIIYSLHIEKYPTLSNKRVAIFIDSSNSMNKSINKPFTVHAHYSVLEDACNFALLLKCCLKPKRGHIFSFKDKAYPISDDSGNDFRSFYSKIMNPTEWHEGTDSYISNPSAPQHYLNDHEIKYDLIFIFTDYDFSYQSVADWKTYRREISPSCKMFLVQLTPFYKDRLDLPEGYYRILEWTDVTAKLILNILNLNSFSRFYEDYEK